MYQYDKNIKMHQQEKASKIMDIFCHNFVKKIGVIDQVFNKMSNTQEIIDTLSYKKKLNFNLYELNNIISQKQIADYSKYITSKEANELYKEIISTYDKDDFPENFSSFIVDTLNELEVICMDISSSAAGTQFLYESLHTLFFKVIQTLYIKISLLNKDNVDTLFINIINVYNSWMIKKTKILKSITK